MDRRTEFTLWQWLGLVNPGVRRSTEKRGFSSRRTKQNEKNVQEKRRTSAFDAMASCQCGVEDLHVASNAFLILDSVTDGVEERLLVAVSVRQVAWEWTCERNRVARSPLSDHSLVQGALEA